MNEVSVCAAVGRVVRTTWQVPFSRCDAFGHLAAPAYLELAIDHRMEAVLEQLGFDTVAHARDSGTAFVLRQARLDFRRPAALGEVLVVESWIDALRGERMQVEVRIRPLQGGSDHARLSLESTTMDLRSGRPIPLPERLPRAREIDLASLPWAEDHPRNAP
ncbi:MAG TPA: thioesterase family protein [Planctomycetota bacterium]